MAGKRIALDTIGRPPARCMLGHMHHFCIDNHSYAVFDQDEQIAKLFVWHVRNVEFCIICGQRLLTVEG